jgi:uncharacterized membrane protein
MVLRRWYRYKCVAKILKLPERDGSGKVAHYVGRPLGPIMEWEAESGEWKQNEVRVMKAISGLPSKMKMRIKFRYQDAGSNKTKVTCTLEYRVPYPLIGYLIDRIYLRPRSRKFVRNAIEGMKKIADQKVIPPIELQLEERKLDHPGYSVSEIAA